MTLPVRRALVLACFCLVVIGPIVAENTAQPASRLVTTAALAEHGTVDLTRYADVLGVDQATYRGELRPDKAPGGPVLGVPFYEIGRGLGFESATHDRIDGNLTLWWQTFWGSMVPFALLVALMYLAARRVDERAGALAALALGFGTLMLPHAVNLYGHALAAALGYGAWLVATRVARAVRAPAYGFAGAGALGAAAVAVEYHAVIVAVVVAAFVGVRAGRRAFAAFAAGATPFLLATAWYQQVAFGRPWHTSYQYLTYPTNGGDYGLPTLRGLVDIGFGAHGLLWTSPIAVIALAAAAVAVGGRRTETLVRGDAVVALAVFVPYALLVAGWTGTPLLEQPGPRYVLPALPFLAVPLAWAWGRVRAVATAATAWGAAVMFAGSVTSHLVGPNDQPFRVYFARVTARAFHPTLWSTAFGRFGAALYATTAVAASVVVVVAFRRPVARANECSTDLVGTGTLSPRG